MAPIEPTYLDDQVAVYDDVMPPELLASLFTWANAQEYQIVHHRGWRKVWRLHDGLPLSGRPTWHRDDGRGRDSSGLEPELDPFIDRVCALAGSVEHLVGRRGAWKSFNVTPWIYPSGSGLSLHADTRRYTGAYTYFLHPEWHLHWGGMLVVLDARTPQRVETPGPRTVYPPWLSDEAEQARIWNPGLGRVILPKPNRLIFLAPDSEHLITKVDSTAGDNPRVTLAGFFHAPDRAERS